MKEGMKFFKLDGPIGRKKYIFVALILSVYVFVTTLVMLIFHELFEVNKYNLVIFLFLWGCIVVPLFVLTWINLTKRLWDLTGDKSNAIFYASAFWIATITMSFIPVLKYVGMLISLIVAAFLLFKKGKFVNVKSEEQNDVA